MKKTAKKENGKRNKKKILTMEMRRDYTEREREENY